MTSARHFADIARELQSCWKHETPQHLRVAHPATAASVGVQSRRAAEHDSELRHLAPKSGGLSLDAFQYFER
jgi:hypothetical protein